MALFKISKGPASQLWTSPQSKAAKNGYAWFTSDEGKLYIDIADANTAVSGVSRIPINSHYADKVLLKTKTYTNVKPTANNDTAGRLYFAKIHRSNYYDIWHVKYRVYIQINGFDSGVSFHEVDIWSNTDTIKTYRSYNTIEDTAYRPMYHHLLYTSSSTGVSNDCGGLLGIRFQSASYVTTAKTIKIEIIEEDNCTVEFLNAFTLFSTLNTTAGWYKTYNELDGYTAGVTITGDRNDTTSLHGQYGTHTAIPAVDGGIGIHRYTLILMNADEKWTSIAAKTTTDAETHITTITAINDNDTAIDKQATTASLLINSPIYYISNNGLIAPGTSAVRTAYQAYRLDMRYSSNCAQTLTAGRAIYLVGTPNSDSTFTLDPDNWYVQELPTEEDGKIYIHLGTAYDTFQVELAAWHPIFEFKNGMLRTFVRKEPLSVVDGGTGIDTNPSLLVNLGSTTAANIFSESPRPGITGTLSIAHGGTAATKRRSAGLPYTWTAKVQGQTWSRICYIPYSYSVTGSNFFLHINATRSNVVYNYTFAIQAHHTQKSSINVISGSTYSGIELRIVSNSSGDCYVELKDSANSVNAETIQNVICTLLILSLGSTDPTLYTSFTTGETLPANYAVSSTLTCYAKAGFQTTGEYTGSGAGLTNVPASSIVGTLGIGHGGTGLTESPSMLVNLASTTAANVLVSAPRPGVMGILPVANGGTGNADGTAPAANELVNKAVNNTTLHNTAGSFSFAGSGAPWASTDWVGIQIGDNNDKFQIVSGASGSNTIAYRQNDSGGTNSSAWGTWQTIAHGPSAEAVGGAYKPVYMAANGLLTEVTANSALVDLASTTAASVFVESPSIGIKGILGTANGGTGHSTYTSGRVIYAMKSTELAGAPAMHINWSEGTTSAVGCEELVIGNSTASGTAGNAYGRLALYSSNTKGAYITAASTTTWRDHVLPATAGWLVTAGNGSSTGAGSQYIPVYVSTAGIATACTSPSLLTNLGSTTAASLYVEAPRPGVTGTLGAANGGTGKTTLNDAANALINALDTGGSALTANDYVITQYVGGGTTTITYHRRPANKVVNATLVKAALGTSNAISSQSQSTKFLREDGTWATPSYTTDTNNKVEQKAPITTDGKYPLLLGYNNVGTTSVYTNTVNRTGAYLYINPNTNTLSAVRFMYNTSGTEKAYTTYNSADDAIDFVFV